MVEMMILRKKRPQQPNGEIRKKLYNRHGKHVGIALAFMLDSKIHVGWSVCSPKDRYNKAMALEIANGRAVANSEVKLPRFAQQQLAEFKARAEKYFNNPNGKRVAPKV